MACQADDRVPLSRIQIDLKAFFQAVKMHSRVQITAVIQSEPFEVLALRGLGPSSQRYCAFS